MACPDLALIAHQHNRGPIVGHPKHVGRIGDRRAPFACPVQERQRQPKRICFEAVARDDRGAGRYSEALGRRFGRQENGRQPMPGAQFRFRPQPFLIEHTAVEVET